MFVFGLRGARWWGVELEGGFGGLCVLGLGLTTLEVTLGRIVSQISHIYHPILVAVEWELTKETIKLPLGCLQGGQSLSAGRVSI